MKVRNKKYRILKKKLDKLCLLFQTIYEDLRKMCDMSVTRRLDVMKQIYEFQRPKIEMLVFKDQESGSNH